MRNELRPDTSEFLRSLYAGEGGVPSAFSARVSDYAAYRPRYPEELFDYLTSKCPPTDDSIAVDVGSGTGLLTRDLLRCGYRTIAVEPSREMREVAERDLGSSPSFRSLEGAAESLPLDAKSVDLIAAAQALQWFDFQRARAEFLRVLKPSGQIAIIWNDRVRGDSLRDAVDLLLSDFGETKHAVLKAQDDLSSVYRFFGITCPQPRFFPNEQRLNEDEFTGLVFSGSFTPLRTSDEGKRLAIELRSLFSRFEREGRVVVRFRTVVFFGRPA